MKKIGVADFKAHLSGYLREVRRGHELTILDRDQPVARITPYATSGAMRVREPSGQYKRLADVPLPPPLKLKSDPVALLLEDRQGGR